MNWENAPETISGSEGEKNYEVGGEIVRVAWKTFEPKEKKETSSDGAVVFIPGWSITEKADSIERLCAQFADYSENPTYAIDARTENIVPNSAEIQAEAIRFFVREKGLNDIVLAGNSLGGAEVVHLAALLQEKDPDVRIEGLVLLDSLSLYDQTVPALAANYTRDLVKTEGEMVAIKAKKMFGREPRLKKSTAATLADQNKKYLTDGTVEILKEIMRSNVDYPRRTMAEIRQMAKTNPHLKDVKAPVVIIQGADDLLSNSDKIIPKPEHREDMRTREAFLKENVFTNAPHVAMIVPEKLGHHNVSYSRPEEVARSSLYMLKRWRREQT
jgi:pimeloyl-ACP methyl ester carboxylesterase